MALIIRQHNIKAVIKTIKKVHYDVFKTKLRERLVTHVELAVWLEEVGEGCLVCSYDHEADSDILIEAAFSVTPPSWPLRELFMILAPFLEPKDPKKPYLSFDHDTADTERWRLDGGKFIIEESFVVYGREASAPTLIEQIVAVIYKEGQPVTFLPGQDYEEILQQVENIVRSGGFGPQAGKTALERLADIPGRKKK